MKQLSYWLISALVLVFVLGACQKDDKIPYSGVCEMPAWDSSAVHPSAAVYQAILDEYTRKGLPGISIAVRDQHGLWMGASGKADIEENVAMTPCHISKAASITKLFVGTTVHLLVEDGVLSYDDPLSKWLPAKYLDKVENAKQATIRQCLNHTSGIADVISDQAFYLSVLNDPDRFWEETELLTFVEGDEPLFPIGTSVEYSNTNFLYLAMVIEAATGRPHHEVVRDKILHPLGLHDTYYYWHEEPPLHRVAQGYYDLYNNGTILNLTNYNTGSGNGYGGMYSTVFDLKNFAEALFREQTVLQNATLQNMLTFTPEEEGTHRANGLGVFKDFLDRAPSEYAYGHRGRDLAYTADLFYFPNQDITFAYLINYGTDADSALKDVFFDFRKAIVDAMMGG